MGDLTAVGIFISDAHFGLEVELNLEKIIVFLFVKFLQCHTGTLLFEARCHCVKVY